MFRKTGAWWFGAVLAIALNVALWARVEQEWLASNRHVTDWELARNFERI